MKQTAVETLFDRIEEIGFIDPAAGQFYEELISLKEQAKAMEKEQLCYFYIKGAEAELNNPYITNIEFYNQTFKS